MTNEAQGTMVYGKRSSDGVGYSMYVPAKILKYLFI